MKLKCLPILTLITHCLCLKHRKTLANISNFNYYDVHSFVKKLDLEVCVFVGIGLKYFAIFVEIEKCNKQYDRFFLGICHSSVLESWTLCPPELYKRNKKKCRFKVNHNRRFHARVHRRFCDFRYMSTNAACQCIPTLFSNDLNKVIGMPTCYIPPLPQSLCQYNICGLEICHKNCDSVDCECDKPFCEKYLLGTSKRPRLPKI